MIETAPAPVISAPSGFRERRRERRRLVEADRRSASLAELHRVALVLRSARSIVERGWVQDGWFAVADEAGVRKVVLPQTLHLLEGREVVGACLVGAVVSAGGGLSEVRSQPVQRSLDLLWHTLRRDSGEPVRWCPGPTLRALQVRDLARWNDTPGRSSAEVTSLLSSAASSADTRRVSLTPA